MGREQGRRREHLLLYIACILAVCQLVAGCAQLTQKLQITTSLAKARDSMDAGDFHTALMENEKALRQPFLVSTSRVLFQRGLIYSHPGNPERDDNAARAYFQKVIDQYPSGDLAEAAKILMALNGRVLSDAEALKSAAEEIKSAKEAIKSVNANVVRLEGMINEQKRSIQRCGEELEGRREDIGKLTSAKDRMELTLKEQRGIIEQYQRVLKDRQELIDKLNKQLEDLKGQIEDFKKIDMNIEKKKQDTKLQ